MPRLKERRRKRYVDLGARPTEFWSRQLVIDCIAAVYKSGITPNVKELKARYYCPKVARILERVTGVRTTPYGLIHAGYKHFGLWDSAVHAAGFDRRQVRADILWQRDHVIRSIHVLNEQQISLASTDVLRDQRRGTARLLSQTVGFKTTSRKLLGAAHRIYGSWAAALAAAGINADQVTLKYWTVERTKRSIQELHCNDVGLSFGGLARNRSDKVRRILLETTGHRTNGKNLIWAAKKHFGSWDNALTAAGIDPRTIRGRPGYWTADTVVQVIRAFRHARLPLSRTGLYSESGGLGRKILRKLTGKKIQAHSLYLAGTYWFGSWEKALKWNYPHLERTIFNALN